MNIGVAVSAGMKVAIIGAGAGATARVSATRSMFSVISAGRKTVPPVLVEGGGVSSVSRVSPMRNEPALASRLMARSRKFPIFSLVARAPSSRSARSASAGEVTRREAASAPSMIWRTR